MKIYKTTISFIKCVFTEQDLKQTQREKQET